MADSVAAPGPRARSGEPAHGGDGPADSFDELRALLVGPEQRELMALQAHVLDPARPGPGCQPCTAGRDRLAVVRSAAHPRAGAVHRVGADGIRPARPAPPRRRAVSRHGPRHPQGDRAHARLDDGDPQSYRRAQRVVARRAVAMDGAEDRPALRRNRSSEHAPVPRRAGLSDPSRDGSAASARLRRISVPGRMPTRSRRC